MPIKDIIYLSGQLKLSLTNSGNLTLFFVGVGSAFSKLHYQTNLLVIKGNDHILIDCGNLSPLALWLYGCPIANIGNIFITHSHADHIGGLEESALMSRYVLKRKPTLIVTEEYQDILWNHSLRGGVGFGEKKQDGKYLELSDFFNIVHPEIILFEPRTIWETYIGSIDLKIFRTKHMPDCAESWKDSFFSYGVLIDERILFTSDTRFDQDLIFSFLERFPSIEYIFHDCQFFKGGVHASYEELSTLPVDIKQKMFLSHYGDNYKNFTPQNDKFLGFAEQGCYYIFD